MLKFGLPEYDSAANGMFNSISNRFHMLDPILRMFPPKEMVHTGAYRQVSAPRILDTKMRRYEATVSVDQSMFIETNVEQFRDFLVEMITSVLEQQQDHAVSVISDTSKTVGTYIDGKNAKVWDVYIQILERLEIAFDEEGKPCPIEIPARFAPKLGAVSPTEAQLDELARITERKRQMSTAKRHRRLKLSGES